MRHSMKVCTFFLRVAAWVILWSGSAYAASGTWSGAGNGYWTNSANWSVSPYPSGADTASFTGAGNSQTTINVAGLSSIKGIFFDTANAASYTLGSGGANVQTLVAASDGVVSLSSTVASDQVIAAALQLPGSYTFTNNAARTLTLNNVTGTTVDKTLNFYGSGPLSIFGNLSRGGNALYVNVNGAGPLSLSGANNQITTLTINGANAVISLAAGSLTTFNGSGGANLTATQDSVINGPGALYLSTGGGENYADNAVANGKTLTINAKLTGATGFEYWHGSYFGTVALLGQNDFTSNVIMNAAGTICVTNVGNQGSTTSNLGSGQRVIFCSTYGGASCVKYTGLGEESNRILEFRKDGIVDQSGASGNVKFTSAVISSGSLTITLQGSTLGAGEIGGGIPGSTSVSKTGAGTWYLSGSNTYSGATTVNAGNLVLRGTNGAIRSSSGLSLAGGSFVLLNSAAVNSSDRLSDSMAITLAGGTFCFSNDLTTANFSETAGALTLSSGANVVAATQAADGGASSVRFASVTRANNGTLNFVGIGLGDSDRNRIFITGQGDGLMGAWATVNGANLAAYSSARGVYASSTTVTNLAARGPDSVVPDDATATASITLPGESGPITLAADWTNRIFQLIQNTDTAATVAMRSGTTNKTLLVSKVMVSTNAAALTLGENEADGFLSSLQPASDITLENDNSNVFLTVKASLVTNGASLSLLKTGPGAVLLMGANSYSGTTTIADGRLIFGGSATQILAGVVNGNGALVKQGAGRLILANSNTYTGDTVIAEGVAVALKSASFGTSAGGTIVSNGAALDLSGSVNDTLNFGTELFTVSGAGPDGLGAVVNTGNSQMNTFGRMTLAGDTTFGGTARWDFRNNSASLAMNGYTLTKTNSNAVVLVETAITPGAGKIDVKQGTLQIEAGTRLNGSSANTLHLFPGTTLGYYQLSYATNATPWTLIMDDRSKVVSYMQTDPYNTWSGPVTMSGTVYFDGSSPYSETFAGSLSGVASIVKTGTGTALLSNTNNTYAGATIVSNGVLYAGYPGSLPGYGVPGTVAVPNGTLAVYYSPDGKKGWTEAQVDLLRTHATFGTTTSILGLDTTWSDWTYTRDLTPTLGIAKYGTNSLTLAGRNLYGGNTLVYGGLLRFPASSVTNNMSRLYIGYATNLSASVVQENCAVSIAPAAGGTDVLSLGWGGTGYGYYRMSGGTLATGQIGLPSSGGGYGVFDLYSGAVDLSGSSNGWLLFGWTGGHGVLTLYGGSILCPPGNDTTLSYTASKSSYSAINLQGPSALLDTSAGGTARALRLSSTSGNLASVVNLNGGTLVANSVAVGTTQTPSFFNFNGGTLKANTSSSVFLQGLTAATVYPGGAAFDVASNAIARVNQSLLAPTGYGLSAVPLRSVGANYIGAPIVVITGGSGTGATAIASVDLADGSGTKGQLTGITVTSPGSSYKNTDALTVSLYGGGCSTAAVTNTCTFALNSAAGGFTKKGLGTLILGGTNTYGGTTVISNGVLQLGVAEALPPRAAVSLIGGTLNLGGFTITDATVTVSSGTIANGTLGGTGIVTKVDNGTLFLSAGLSPSGSFVVKGGTVRLDKAQPGLYEAPLSGSFNTTEGMVSNITVRLTTRMANTNSIPPWSDQVTYLYSGYLWNRAGTNVTWTFGENVDDNTMLKIDGTTLIANGNGWSTPTIATMTLTPGAHAFEARFGNGTGGAGLVDGRGANSLSWWKTNAFGFGVDYLGRNDTNIANYVSLTDPGDGSLLTLTATGSNLTNLMATATSVELSNGAVLDLNDHVQTLSGLSGTGSVSNGTLTVNGVIAPGGTNVIGTLSVAAAATLNGTLLMDVAADGTSDLLAITGDLSLSSLALVVANPAQLNRQKQYTLVTCTGARTGTFGSVTVPDNRWHVIYSSGGTVKLIFVNGTLISLR